MDPERSAQAFASRDACFDDRLCVDVSSTGIYCCLELAPREFTLGRLQKLKSP